MEKLQQSLLSVESEVELLRSQLHTVNEEKLSHDQEVTDLQRKLQDAQNKVSTETLNVQGGDFQTEGPQMSPSKTIKSSSDKQVETM